MADQLAVVALLGLAAYRLTRLLTADAITERLRSRVARWAYNDRTEEFRSERRQKVAYFVTCPFCVGVYVAAATYAWWDHFEDARFVVLVAAVAGAQSFLASRPGA